MADFIGASNKLLEARDLSDEEEDSVRVMLWQLCAKFPGEADEVAN